MKIYLDVLIITNSLLTMCYLECLTKLSHSKITNKRMILACFIGGISSLLVIMNITHIVYGFIVTLLKLASIFIIVFTAFNFNSLARYIKYVFLYLLINVVFAGICILFWQTTGSKIIMIKNLTLYFDLSLITLTLATIFTYAAISLYEFITRKVLSASNKYYAVYTFGNYEIRLPAIADTGNKLTDIFTGTPVVIFYCNELYNHFNLDNESQLSNGGFHCIPFSTISGDGIIKVTSRGSVCITDGENERKEISCAIGIICSGDNRSKAIFHPSLLL